ncbi:hypothetical protein DB31_1971 [Hyalangium minutum]|uniref:Uncharacterized protein n=1 Tax=Hyalangium minutum TaxID=394096 RepID=A0A085WB90_9BACT|nr:hypothetical protein DB31_1971 [Hyalangium minutum]
MYFWLERYLRARQVEALRDAPRSGRPPAAARITAELIFQELSCPPSDWGYSTHTWTVAMLAAHLERRYGCAIHPDEVFARITQQFLAVPAASS